MEGMLQLAPKDELIQKDGNRFKVTSFIRVRDIKRKSDDNLQEMAARCHLKVIAGVKS